MENIMTFAPKTPLWRELASSALDTLFRRRGQKFNDSAEGITAKVLCYTCMAAWIAICFVPLLRFRRLLCKLAS